MHMSHHHGGGEDSEGAGRYKRFRLVLVLNLVFVVVELVGSALTGSRAVFADAIHDLGDVFALLLGLYAEKRSQLSADSHYTMGYSRWSTLGSLVVGGVIFLGGGLAIAHSVPALFAAPDVHAPGMMGLAVFGIAINLAGALILRDRNHATESLLSLHLIEDIFGWVAVLIGGVVIALTGWTLVDPIFAIVISVFVMFHAVRHLKRPVQVFLQRAPSVISLEQFQVQCLQVPGVVSLHDLHHWSLSEDKHILTLHLVVSSGTDGVRIKEIKETVRSFIPADARVHTTIEVEPQGQLCGQGHSFSS